LFLFFDFFFRIHLNLVILLIDKLLQVCESSITKERSEKGFFLITIVNSASELEVDHTNRQIVEMN
jgi:hypothetical protein